MLKFIIDTLGCKVNTYESQVIREALLSANYIEANEKDDVDLVIVNTCTVTQVASQKSRQKLHHYRTFYPKAIIVGVGCFIQTNNYSDDLCDIYIGTKDKSSIVNIIEEYIKEKKTIKVLDEPRNRTCYEKMHISSYKDNTRAFVKIQDGCDNFCSYCIIPFIRGKFRSRPREDVLNEVHELVNNGFKEIVLTGIDTAGYGKDINDSFVDLIKTILKQEPLLRRLRISSIEASQIHDDFIELLKDEPRIARHLHIPLQSGSESVLKRMNRKYSKEEFKSRIDKVKDAVKDIALACDVIVGFPLESEEEYLESVDFIKECGFNYLHVFPYSIRPNTAAANMKPQISQKVKKERVKRLIEIGNELENNYYKKFDNKELEIIVEAKDKKTNMWKGYSSNYILVNFPYEGEIQGKICKVIYHYGGISELVSLEK